MVETTALGAAILAGIGAGLIDINDVDGSKVTKFLPAISENGKRSYIYLLYVSNNLKKEKGMKNI